MFEKLLSLLLHAKGGAVATVLVLGASGALVTATVENGLATVTLTQPGTTTSSETTTTTTDPAILALFSNLKKHGSTEPEGSTEPATGNGCSDAAHATNEQVKRVNDAYKTDHAAVLALSKDAPKTEEARKLVKDADTKIKDLRQEAVKAIHGLFKSDECKGNDDEDAGATTGATDGTTSTTTTTTTVAISCTDAKACADAAIAEMDKVVEELKTELETPTAAPVTTNTNVAPGKSDKGRDNHDNKGKGKGHD